MLGRKQSLLDILNSIIYVVLAGNNFLHLATKRKEEEIGPENVAILFFLGHLPKKVKSPQHATVLHTHLPQTSL